MSVGFNVAGIALAVGSTVLIGRGNATGVIADLDGFTADYRRTEARSRIAYLHLTGATRAAEDVSKKTASKIKERQKRKKEEEERRLREAEEEELRQEEEARDDLEADTTDPGNRQDLEETP